jgi:hypothetical protein
MPQASHWFFVSQSEDELGDPLYLVYTYGLGDHPMGKHMYSELDEFRLKLKEFLQDGYELMTKDQFWNIPCN